MRNAIVLSSLIMFLLAVSCQKENFSNDPALKLSFSTDTLMFDTVFTTIGSATRYFKVYNRNKSDLIITTVSLAGGNSSPYRINIDGEPSHQAKDVVLRARDSLFVFVEVTVDPTDQNSPMLIPDSVVFETNGNFQNVKLMSWGQDVHMLRGQILYTNTLFTADKPYLIIDSLWVLPGVELSIDPGAHIHLHNNTLVHVAGSLKVNGLPDDPVIFEGDRLEMFYRDKAGQWGGIWLRAGSRDNHINWAEIKNGILGVVVDTFSVVGMPTLKIENTKIINMSYTALYARGAIVEAGNCLFANVAYYPVALTLGGRYRFYHCTIANYWGQYINRKGPALFLNNYYEYQLEPPDGPWYLETRDLEEAYFANCIIYGTRSNELEVDNIYNGQPVDAQMNYKFENTILRVDTGFDLNDETRFVNLVTENPKFIDPKKNDFQLDTLSPAKDFGLYNIAISFPVDLNNVSRLDDEGPDLGAYERVE